MAVLLVSDYGKDRDEWVLQLGKRIPDLELRAWPDIGNPDEIEMVLVDTIMTSKGGFGQFPNLAWVHYLGHGVGDILRDPSLPSRVAVTRQKRKSIADGLAIYVVQAIAAHHLHTSEYRKQQDAQV